MCKNRSFVVFRQIWKNYNWSIFPFLISFTFLFKGVISASLRQVGNFDGFEEVLKMMHQKSLNVLSLTTLQL